MNSAVLNESAQRYFQPKTALSRVIAEAPYFTRCSDNKTAARIRPREFAIRYPYMQVNRTGMVSWLIFDLDHNNPLVWESAGLPAPNLVVSNRHNGHPHLFYAIIPVCTSEKARSKPIRYMKAIYKAMATKLNADPAYSGPVAKTPGHPWWRTWEIHSDVYELGELADSLDLPLKPYWSRKENIDAVSHSRHCLLFEELRFFAYSVVSKEREQGSFISFSRQLESFAHSHNAFTHRGFATNLTQSQVMATVKSVARWTWDRYTGSLPTNKGVMRLDSSLSLRERQQKAAKRTHKSRRQSTQVRIQQACQQLTQQGLKLTQTAVARLAGLSRQTVAKYRHLLNRAEPTSLATPATKSSVKHAVHQIPAPQDCQQNSAMPKPTCSKDRVSSSSQGSVTPARSFTCESYGSQKNAVDAQIGQLQSREIAGNNSKIVPITERWRS